MSTGGVSVPEALIALLLGMLIAHLGLDTMARFRSTQVGLSARSDELVALRIGRHVLRRELRHGRPGWDWAQDGDSLALRAFRGTALICTPDSVTAELAVAYRGDRWPDPSKDSVLLLDASGGRVVRALAAVAPTTGGCPAEGPGTPARWRLDHEVPAGVVLARLFERGSYHLAGSALRYRRGLSGRQPLTPTIWSPQSGWIGSAARLAVEVVPLDAPTRTWRGFLSWTPTP